MKRVFVLAAAAFIIAAPISLAQTNQQPSTPPPTAAPDTTTTPAPTTPPTTQPAAPPTEPATPPAQSTPAPASTPASSPQGCRTQKAAGESCACLSDTNRVGTSTSHPDGHNVCVRPD